MEIVNKAVEEYAKNHSKPEPEYIRKVREFTMSQMANSQMLSGSLEGNFLKMVVQLTGASQILELGTYTGYSALWMAEGMRSDGQIITCDASPDHAKIARDFFDQSPYGKKIEIKLGKGIETLETLRGPFDIAFIDADKENYPAYYEKIVPMLRSGGSILIDNTLWSGKVLNPEDPSTKAIHKLNEMILKDDRVTSALITIRDGIQWAVKK